MLTLWKCTLVHNRAPGAGQLVHVQTDCKLIAGVGLQVLHEQTLFSSAKTGQDILHSTMKKNYTQVISQLSCADLKFP